MFKVCACIVIHFHDAKLLLSQLPRASVYNVNTLPESTGLSSGDNILFRATSFVYLNNFATEAGYFFFIGQNK